jgi:hypothetical protein
VKDNKFPVHAAHHNMAREALHAAGDAAPLPANIQAILSEKPARFSPETIEDVQRISRIFYDGGLMPKHFYDDKRVAPEDRRPAGIAGLATMIMYGAELGLSPMQAMRMMHVIEGRPVLSAEGCVALIKRSAKCVYFRVVEESDEHCICETVRRGDDGKPEPSHKLTVRVWWGKIEEMPKAEKGTLYVLPSRNRDGSLAPAWQRTPGRMVKARCSSWLGHDVYEDVLAGLYSAEEVVDFRDGRPVDRIQERIFDMVAEAPAVVRGAGTDPDAPTAAPVPTAEPAQETPAKPVFDRAAGLALLNEIRGVSETIEPEQVEALRMRVKAFDGTPAAEPLATAWNASGILNLAQVAT